MKYVEFHLANSKGKAAKLEGGEKQLKGHLESQAFYKLVVKMEIKLSMPEQKLLHQEDPPVPLGSSEEPCMFFIAKGRYDVFIKKTHATAMGSGSDKKAGRECSLSEGDHFGEIGLIYGCRRTATVESTNYGTLAMLTRSNFWELQKSFDGIVESFKNQICLYEDEVKLFLEMALEKIDYFKNLNVMTQQEVIYSMERVTYEKDHNLINKDDVATEMFVIQEGIVEVAC